VFPMSNTVKSVLKFYKSVISKYSPIRSKENTIGSIVNYIKCNDSFSLSGQPTKSQFSFIRKGGYEIIINLAPYDLLENPLKNEESIVTELGMKYVHIPVNMLNPAQEDFDAFVNIMKNASGKKILVHCAIGMRASAFLYKYRCFILGENTQTAIWDLREIWEPFGAWKKFLFSETT
jgi:protein tyrosine phosphatase (PTP) superfamily phosphohydrolase (DUF442 family)